MKVLITGASGQLGSALVHHAPAERDVIAVDRATLDIGDRAAVMAAFDATRPQLVLNAAAYTAVDNAEKDRAASFRVNADGPGHLAEAAQRQGARLFHVSTDYVFDGAGTRPYRPDDPTAPINAYGESKLAGERAVLERSEGRALIVRTAWVYAAAGKNFLLTMQRLMRERDEVRVVADQQGTPTHAASLARALWRWADIPAAQGIRHWTDAGQTTWFGFASAIRETLARAAPGGKLARLTPIATREYPTPARRPGWSVLDCSASEPGPARPWQDELEDCLRQQAGLSA